MLRVTSSSVVAHELTLMRMAGRPCQTVPPHQQVPSAWTAATIRSVTSALAEGHQDLVEHYVVENLVSRPPTVRTQTGEPSGSCARSGRQPVAAEREQRRPDLDPPAAPGHLGGVVGRVALPTGGRQVLGRDGHRSSERIGSRTNARPLSYGTLSHLCASVAHESASSMPRVSRRRLGTAAAHRPNAPSTCTQAAPSRARAQISAERVDRPGVHVPRLRADDRRAVDSRHLVGAHPALVVDGHPHNPVPAQAEHPECLDQRRVDLVADDDGDRRRPEQAVGFDVPSRLGEHGVPRRRQCGEVGDRRAGRETRCRSVGQPEQVDQPAQGDLLQASPSPARLNGTRISGPRHRRASSPPTRRAANRRRRSRRSVARPSRSSQRTPSRRGDGAPPPGRSARRAVATSNAASAATASACGATDRWGSARQVPDRTVRGITKQGVHRPPPSRLRSCIPRSGDRTTVDRSTAESRIRVTQ